MIFNLIVKPHLNLFLEPKPVLNNEVKSFVLKATMGIFYRVRVIFLISIYLIYVLMLFSTERSVWRV